MNEYKTKQYTHATIADASKERRSQSSVQESIELVLYLVGGHIYCQVGRIFAGLALGPNCLQRFPADNSSSYGSTEGTCEKNIYLVPTTQDLVPTT